MNNFLKKTENEQEINNYTSKNLTTHLIKGGDGVKLQKTLCNPIYIDKIIDHSKSNTATLIRDYDSALESGILEDPENIAAVRKFIRKFAQELSEHENSFFSLCLNFGPPQVQTVAKKLFEESGWKKPYFKIGQIFEVERYETSTKKQNEQIDLQTSLSFPSTPIVALAPDIPLVFFYMGMGEIGAANIAKNFVYPSPALRVRNHRLTSLICSDNGRYLLVLYDDNKGDLFLLDYSKNRLGRKIFSVEYLRPKFDNPVAFLTDAYCIYQDTSGDIIQLDLDSKQIVNSYKIKLPSEKIGELSGIAQLGIQRKLITLRLGEDTHLVTLDPQGNSRILQSFSQKDITEICKCCEDQVAVAFMDQELIIIEINEHIKNIAKITLDFLPICMTWTGTHYL